VMARALATSASNPGAALAHQWRPNLDGKPAPGWDR
jgi:hypothetical protein